MELFLSMILAHVIADFLLQSPQIAADKCRGLPRGYLLHFTGHLIALGPFNTPLFFTGGGNSLGDAARGASAS
ncbi:MAG: DUF3307 domain-containing protein [Dethiobacteria bacterium]